MFSFLTVRFYAVGPSDPDRNAGREIVDTNDRALTTPDQKE